MDGAQATAPSRILRSPIGLPPPTRAKAPTRIGLASAAAHAYQRSEPRWIHATGCFISRLARIVSSLASIRLPLPENQSFQRRSIQAQQAMTRRTTTSGGDAGDEQRSERGRRAARSALRGRRRRRTRRRRLIVPMTPVRAALPTRCVDVGEGIPTGIDALGANLKAARVNAYAERRWLRSSSSTTRSG